MTITTIEERAILLGAWESRESACCLCQDRTGHPREWRSVSPGDSRKRLEITTSRLRSLELPFTLWMVNDVGVGGWWLHDAAVLNFTDPGFHGVQNTYHFHMFLVTVLRHNQHGLHHLRSSSLTTLAYDNTTTTETTPSRTTTSTLPPHYPVSKVVVAVGGVLVFIALVALCYDYY